MSARTHTGQERRTRGASPGAAGEATGGARVFAAEAVPIEEDSIAAAERPADAARRGADARAAGEDLKRAADGKRPSRLALFLRSSALDFIMVLVVSVGLDFMLLSGFDATLELRWDLLLQLGAAAIMAGVLFIGAWSKRSVLTSVVGVIVVLACAVALGVAMTPADVQLFVGGMVNDEEGNYLIFCLVITIVPIMVYLLSRRPWGVAILLVAAVVVCACVQYLFRDWLAEEGGLVAAAITLTGVLTMLVYQSYRQSAFSADRLRTPAFGRAALFSLLVALICVFGGGALFYGIIEPLQLSTPIYKPFELYVIRPIVEYSGVYDDAFVEDPDWTTSLLNDDEEDTSEEAEGGEEPEEEAQEGANNPLSTFVQNLTTYSQDNWNAAFSPVSYQTIALGALLGLLAVLLVLLVAVLIKILGRRRRLKKLASRPPSERVVELYDFFCSRFARLGIERSPALTPLEFAYASRKTLVPFTRDTGSVDFVRVTLLYQRGAYGTGDVSEEEYAQVERYYRAFFGNARRYVGMPKWLITFWRM